MFWIPLMMAGATAVSAYGQMQAGRQNKAAAQASAAAAKIEGENARLRATQIGELSRLKLAQTLSTQQAIMASGNLSSNSATAQALERKTIENAYRDEAINRLGELNRASASDSAAAGYTIASRYAMPLATLGATSTALSGGAKAWQTYKPGT